MNGGGDGGGFEKWDAEFLDQLIQVEELALFHTQSSNSNPEHSALPFPPLPPPQSDALRLRAVSHDKAITFSPPRELSQRTSDFESYAYCSSVSFAKCEPSTSSSNLAPCFPSSDIEKDIEILRLKRELGRVSEQLTVLEQECVELRKQGDQKEEGLKVAISKNDEKFSNNNGLNSTKRRKIGNDGGCNGSELALDHGRPQQFLYKIPSSDRTGPRRDIATSTCKSIGIQTDKAHDSPEITFHDDLPACHDLSKKLLSIWVSPIEKLGRNLVSKLLMSCETDFHVLFGCMSMKLSPKNTINTPLDNQTYMDSLHGPEGVKVSRLYTMLAKVSNGMVLIEALFASLLDLCSLDNVVIVHKSLHVLHVFLKHLLSLERKSERRKNVMVERIFSRNSLVYSHGSGGAKGGGLSCVTRDRASDAGLTAVGFRCSDTDILHKDQHLNSGTNLVALVDWVSLFELMHQIAMKHTEECIRLEAVSIMNVIIMRSNAHTERENFGQTFLFECVLHLMKNEAGLQVKKLAVHLLFLILNCPTLCAAFCSGCKEGEAIRVADDNVSRALNFQKFGVILQGLADCVACSGNGILELKLRRNAIILLAFLASSGKAGFEILVKNNLSRESSFLMLILRAVVSEMDIEVAVGAEPPEIIRERTLLIREALILLNRLVSYPAYSATVLRVLTNSRDMASLTIDLSTGLSWKDWTRQTVGSEISDLARVFKKRVFTYLGDNVS